jgi:hypothetical protein
MRAATLFSSTTMAAAAILLFSSLLVSRTSAFHPTTIGLTSSPTMANAAAVRVSTELHYVSSADDNNSSINNFSELDKLRAKRKNLLKRPSYQQQPSASAMPSMPSKKQGLEYLYDQSEERHADDFFHVILMPSTFTKNQVSIEHATESILSTLLSSSTSSGEEYTYTKIRELTTFTKHQVFTLLGTWTRSECLDIGHQLQEMDLDVRVIPYSEGLLEMNTAAAVVASSSSPSSPPMRSSSPQLSSLPSPSLLEETSSDGNDDKVVVVGGRSSRRSSAASSSSDYLLSL